MLSTPHSAAGFALATKSVCECREGVSTPLYPCGLQGGRWRVPPAVPPDAILTHPAPADSSRCRAPRDSAIAAHVGSPAIKARTLTFVNRRAPCCPAVRALYPARIAACVAFRSGRNSCANRRCRSVTPLASFWPAGRVTSTRVYRPPASPCSNRAPRARANASEMVSAKLPVRGGLSSGSWGTALSVKAP
jgi:hypothetical protein